MTRGWKIGLGIVGAVIAFNLALAGLNRLTGGTPGGPRSSSYATGATGIGAYADLLGRGGHPVTRVRTLPHAAALRPDQTVVLLDPPSVARPDALALRAFVRGGGRLVTGGAASGWLRYLLPDAPQATEPGERHARPLAPAPELAGVAGVEAAAESEWESTGAALPLLGGSSGSLLAAASLGRGRVLALADPSPLQNRLLDHADNAQLGLGLAGARGRPVVFLESYHGYGRSSGLAAIPLAWDLLLGCLALAALGFMWARGRRLGPPEPDGRALPPPRAAYVDALGGVLARTHAPGEAAEPVRARVRDAVIRRSALAPDADDATVRAAGARLGLADDELDAVVGGVKTDADVLAAGRALARIGQDAPRR